MQRLKSRAQFQAVLAGQTVARSAHFAVHRLVLPAEVSNVPSPSGDMGSPASMSALSALFPGHAVWMGAMAPKRWAKRAVTRNTIKRQVFAVTTQFAPFIHQLPVAAYVLRLRAGFDRKLYVSATSDALKTAVRAELLDVMSRLCQDQRPEARS